MSSLNNGKMYVDEINRLLKENKQLKEVIESLTAELDTLHKAYAVTNESWRKLAVENEQLRQERAPSTYSLFPECVSCTLPKIGTCTIAGDCKSCSNPEVNKQGYTVAEYHNPEDVRALMIAKDALVHNMPWPAGTQEYRESMDAIAAIDALGVGE